MIKQGILIIAVGHSNYLLMSLNLAASIKVNNTDLHIALATEKPAPVELTKGLIDVMVNIPEEFISVNGEQAFIKSKLHMYELSPFKETIFLDADQIMINDRSLLPIFEELGDVSITFSNTGMAKTSIWADIKEVQKLYGKKPFWNFHSEFVYFKKCKEAKQYFDEAKKVFTDNKIKSATKFAGSYMADELAFQAAAMITGIYPHQENWLPNFWYDRDQKQAAKYPYELTNNVTYSIGGKSTPSRIKNNYNNLAKHYFALLGLSNAYQVQDKQSFLPERKSI